LQDNEGKTALMHAVLKENQECIQFLLNLKTINLILKDKNGKTAKDYAKEIKNKSIEKLF
jgi:ankyrin repeat protein